MYFENRSLLITENAFIQKQRVSSDRISSFQPRKKISLNHMKRYSSILSNTTAEINNDCSETSVLDEKSNNRELISDDTHYPNRHANSIIYIML